MLPFENLSGDPENAYFSNGIAAEILSHLVSVPGLKVVSVKGVRGQAADARQIGREVGVTAVLEGDVRRAGNRVRVTARMTNTETGALMWASEPVDRELSDIFSVQAEIAVRIAEALNAVLTPQLKESVERRPTENLEAYDAYLRGVDYSSRSQEERDFRAAVASFERAVSLDPSFALAHAMLTYSHAALWWYHYDRTPQRIAMAKASIDRALALQPDSPEVRAALGWFVPRALLQAQFHDLLGQREAALKSYSAAVTLLESKLKEAPDDPRFHGSLGIAYAGLGRKSDAVAEGKQALALLPVSKEAYRGAFHVEEMARIYAMVGERDAAIEQLEYLMSIPFDLAGPGLRLDPAWDSLRDHPRFQKLAGASGK